MSSHSVRELYHKFLKQSFPPVRFAFAYGSAVFQQHGRPKGKMLDVVFAVDDPLEWHTENLSVNREHYSFMKVLGAHRITQLERCSAGVYYNTLVSLNSQLLKYGVTSVSDLCDDLLNWRWLYISGRLHKPVLVLTDLSSEDRISNALKSNLQSAATCAVLLLDQEVNKFSLEDLFMTIAGLSFKGDFRMLIGEDRNKIHNIIKPNMAQFTSLYQLYLEGLVRETECGKYKLDEDKFDQFSEPLPSCVHQRVSEGKSLQQALSSIVRESSIKQSAKGILTAGIVKTMKYSFDKLQKMFKSLYRSA